MAARKRKHDVTKSNSGKSTDTDQNDDVDKGLSDHVVTQTLESFYWNEERKERNSRGAVDLLEKIAPRDSLESILATQMIAVHNATMECFRRATMKGLSEQEYNSFLSQGQRCAALFQRQLETLDRRRGKGQQKVTVEYVHVGPGGQAIVGNVNASQRREDHGAKAVEGPDPAAPAFELPDRHTEAVPVPKQRARRHGGT